MSPLPSARSVVDAADRTASISVVFALRRSGPSTAVLGVVLHGALVPGRALPGGSEGRVRAVDVPLVARTWSTSAVGRFMTPSFLCLRDAGMAPSATTGSAVRDPTPAPGFAMGGTVVGAPTWTMKGARWPCCCGLDDNNSTVFASADSEAVDGSTALC